MKCLECKRFLMPMSMGAAKITFKKVLLHLYITLLPNIKYRIIWQIQIAWVFAGAYFSYRQHAVSLYSIVGIITRGVPAAARQMSLLLPRQFMLF